MESDLFDELLGLEDQFYEEGYRLGLSEGQRAGKIEGRVFGLEKGFEKYVECGNLHGRSIVWLARRPKTSTSALGLLESSAADTAGNDTKATESCNAADVPDSKSILPRLPRNSRLEKHVSVLHALTEPASLSTENSEDAATDFDDRYKRAVGKVKLIEKLTREVVSSTSNASGNLDSPGNPKGAAMNNIEEATGLKTK